MYYQNNSLVYAKINTNYHQGYKEFWKLETELDLTNDFEDQFQVQAQKDYYKWILSIDKKIQEDHLEYLKSDKWLDQHLEELKKKQNKNTN